MFPVGARRGAVNWRLIVGALLALVVVALAVSSYLFLLRPGPEQVVRRYFLALEMGDAAALRATLNAQSAALIPPDAELDGSSALGEAGLEIGRARIEGDRAWVPIKTRGAVLPGMPLGSGEERRDFVAVREEGQWKVDLLATIRELLGGPPAPVGSPGGGPPPAEDWRSP